MSYSHPPSLDKVNRAIELLEDAIDTLRSPSKEEEDGAGVEPILKEDPHRFVLFPIKHADLYKKAKEAQACLWTAEEIDLDADLKDWETLTDDQRHFITMVLAFFAASDGIVNENLAANFSMEIQYPESRYFYGIQMYIENVHSEVYSQLIDTFIKDEDEKHRIFSAIDTFPSIKRKADWALRWTDREKANFAERLIAFAIVEGVFFSASFCSIFWLKHQQKMPGLCFSNQLISRDEGLHCDFAALQYRNHVIHKLPVERVYEIMDSAVEAEEEFIRDALKTKLTGIDSNSMIQYMKFVADSLLLDLGVPKRYHVSNPFDWMDMISTEGKTNFLERRVGEYAMSKVGQSKEDRTIRFDEDY